MDAIWKEKLTDAIWIGKALFDRGKVTGSTSNLSFRHGDGMYITTSGSCFGRLTPEHFAYVGLDGAAEGRRPSKEFPLHLALYRRDPACQAVLHTHSLYSTLWSCQEDVGERAGRLGAYTPYLNMLADGLTVVPYAPPGSGALFQLFEERAGEGRAYLLQNHGPLVGGKSLLDAFYLLEELEMSARVSWLLRGTESAVAYSERHLGRE